jgi:hypothetical protein
MGESVHVAVPLLGRRIRSHRHDMVSQLTDSP